MGIVGGRGGGDLLHFSLYCRQEIRAQHYPEVGAYTLGGGDWGGRHFSLYCRQKMRTQHYPEVGVYKNLFFFFFFASLGLRGCFVTFQKPKPNWLCLYGWCSVFSGGERLTQRSVDCWAAIWRTLC